MVLINIESLSDNELRIIAQQEELEDWESLSRQELIDELQDLYDDDNVRAQDNNSGSSRRKFVNTLTDVQSDNVLSLPGVESLPEQYNETSIHMIMKDFNWAYVFWSISSQQMKELEDSGCSLVLRNTRFNADGTEEAVYDIDIALSDNSWTVELPYVGYTYRASLVSVCKDRETVICQSTDLTTEKSWLTSHAEELGDDVTFRTIFSSVIRKGGEVIMNGQVQALLEQLENNRTFTEVDA